MYLFWQLLILDLTTRYQSNVGVKDNGHIWIFFWINIWNCATMLAWLPFSCQRAISYVDVYVGPRLWVCTSAISCSVHIYFVQYLVSTQSQVNQRAISYVYVYVASRLCTSVLFETLIHILCCIYSAPFEFVQMNCKKHLINILSLIIYSLNSIIQSFS